MLLGGRSETEESHHQNKAMEVIKQNKQTNKQEEVGWACFQMPQ